MFRILLPCCAALAASTPLPQEAARRSPTPAPGSTVQEATASNPAEQNAGDRGQAAQGPMLDPVSAAENPAPAMPMDSPEEARGRRTLSTAFVRVGPDGHLTVELHNGRMLVLRDVVMRPKDYCGNHVLGGTRYCGKYPDVAAARPGGAPASDEPEPAASNPIAPKRGASHRR